MQRLRRENDGEVGLAPMAALVEQVLKKVTKHEDQRVFKDAELLSLLGNLSFLNCLTPGGRKVVIMASSTKKGSEGALGNYRPGSLTSAWSKSMGSGVKGRVNAHLDKQNALGKS